MPTYGYLLPTRNTVLSDADNEPRSANGGTDVVELATRAEAMGFASVWAGDSVLAKPRLDPLVTLAAVASATDEVSLGTAVYLPPLRNPVHVAHLTATLDQLSGGRLQFGIGVGIGPDVRAEYENLGVPFEERGPRMDELLEIVTRLWSEDALDYEGRFYTLDDASIGFGTVEKPRIYIPTAAFDPTEGFPRSVRERLLEYGDGWLPIALPPDAYAESLDAIRTLLEREGRDPASFDPGLYLDVVIDDESAAIETARRFYSQYYPAWGTLSDDRIRNRGAFGPPSHVADVIERFQRAGVETMVIRFTATDQREQLGRFVDSIELG